MIIARVIGVVKLKILLYENILQHGNALSGCTFVPIERSCRSCYIFILNTILRTVFGSVIDRLGSCPSPGKITINFPGRAI